MKFLLTILLCFAAAAQAIPSVGASFIRTTPGTHSPGKTGVQVVVVSCNSDLRWAVNLSHSFDFLVLEKCGRNKLDGDKPGNDMVAYDAQTDTFADGYYFETMKYEQVSQNRGRDVE